MIEIYKTKKSLNPSFMEDIFVERPSILYDLRNNDGLLVPRANTTAHGIETMLQADFGIHYQKKPKSLAP